MFSICVVFSLIALTQAADVAPVQSSQVDVRQSGGDFSYSIHESIGVGGPVHIQHDEHQAGIEEAKEKHVEPNQGTIHHDQKPEARAHADSKELKKPGEVGLIAQPLVAAPLEYYGFYYPFYGYSTSTVSRASLIPSMSSIPAIPYPYTLIKTA